MAAVTRDGDKVVFTGEVTPEAAEKLVKEFDSGARLLVATSEGGDAAAGLVIGQSMHKHGVSIVVDHYCISACANYLFLGAKEKALMSGAVLGYHGGIYQDGAPGTDNKIFDMQAHIAFLETVQVSGDLLKKSFELTKREAPAVNIKITSNGKTAEFASLDAATGHLAKLIEKKKKFDFKMTRDPVTAKGIYFPSRLALAGFGVTGIVNYPYPESQQAMTALGKGIMSGVEPVGDF